MTHRRDEQLSNRVVAIGDWLCGVLDIATVADDISDAYSFRRRPIVRSTAKTLSTIGARVLPRMRKYNRLFWEAQLAAHCGTRFRIEFGCIGRHLGGGMLKASKVSPTGEIFCRNSK
jgi:hypothetical protein